MSTPATHLDPLIKQWSRIHQQTAKVMAVSPSDKFDWKTCDSAMTLGALVNHFYLAEVGLVDAVLTGKFGARKFEPKTSAEDAVAAFDQAHEELVAAISSLTPEQLAEEIAPFGDKYGTMTRKALLHSMQEHEIHHRGQLYVYLRILGTEVPPLFG
ncbi:MAG: DinB family protein [Acidobacteriota bacterium]